MNMPLVLLNRRRRGFTAFSPSTLFSSTAIGIWLDPSDLTTMFSDRAGTTPVTTPGTVVGLRLDKSKGLVLGAEQSPAFSLYDTVLTGTWAASGANYVFTDTAGGQSRPGVQWPSISLVAGWYQIVVVVAAINGATQVRVDGVGATDQLFVVGTNTRIVNVTSTSRPRFRLEDLSTTIGDSFTITSISVRELPGNHAVAPTDAARPIYGVEPKGGRRNLLLQTEAFGSSDWVKSGVTASAHNVADPDGGFTASTITATASPGYFYPNTGTINPNSGSTAPSLWIRRRTGSGDVRLRTTSTPGVDTPITVTSSWQRISLVCAAVNGSNCWVLSLATSGDAIDVWHPQLELGSTATAYQRVTTAYDVTESGVATCHYVQYDGSDDSLSTAAIDFTATDKTSVFAGVRKLSDAAQGVVVELSATVASNSGSFLLAAPDGATATFGFDSKGTVQVDAVASSLTAPISRIVTGLADIAGDRATIRIDGVQADQDTGDQGTGNFGNYPLFIGRRNNATLPFNGRDYGLIVVGKAASAGEISDTETWLAARTAQVTL